MTHSDNKLQHKILFLENLLSPHFNNSLKICWADRLKWNLWAHSVDFKLFLMYFCRILLYYEQHNFQHKYIPFITMKLMKM